MLRPTLTTLRSAPLLNVLPEQVLKNLTGTCSWSEHKPGDPIMRQNDDSTDICFILSGFVKIVRGGGLVSFAQNPKGAAQERRGGERKEIMVALVGPGDLVGEVSALLERGRSASVVALTPCQVTRMPRVEFMRLLEQHPSFAVAISRKLAHRLMDADRQLELMRGSVEGRIRALLRHSEQMGIDVARWLTNAEIARMVGATRVAVSQIVSRQVIAKKSG